MDQLIIIVLLVVGLVVCLVKAGVVDPTKLLDTAKHLLQPYAAKPLTTPNELQFYHLLVRSLPEHTILVQTSMGALVAPKHDVDGPSAHRTRSAFDRKIVDYCIVERQSLEVLALVELDDRMHRAERDAKRDAITLAAGYRTLRFWSASRPDTQQIRAALAAALNAPPKVHFIQYGGPVASAGLGAVASLFQRPERR